MTDKERKSTQNKTTVSKASSYSDIGEFWDHNDATEFGEQKRIDIEVGIKSQQRYYPVDDILSLKIKKMAKKQGISEETLLNLWIKEKIEQSESEPAV